MFGQKTGYPFLHLVGKKVLVNKIISLRWKIRKKFKIQLDTDVCIDYIEMSNNSRTICWNNSFKTECPWHLCQISIKYQLCAWSRLYSLPFISMLTLKAMDFSCGSGGKESNWNAGDLGLIPGLDSWVEKIPHYFGYSRFILNLRNQIMWVLQMCSFW